MPRRTTHLWTACGSSCTMSHNSQRATVQWQTTQGTSTEFEGYQTGRNGEKAFWKKLRDVSKSRDISKSRLATKFVCLFLRCNWEIPQMLTRSDLKHKETLRLFAQKSFSPQNSTHRVLKRCYTFIVTNKLPKHWHTKNDVMRWNNILHLKAGRYKHEGVISQRKLVSLPQVVYCVEAIIIVGESKHGGLFQLCLLGHQPSRVQ